MGLPARYKTFFFARARYYSMRQRVAPLCLLLGAFLLSPLAALGAETKGSQPIQTSNAVPAPASAAAPTLDDSNADARLQAAQRLVLDRHPQAAKRILLRLKKEPEASVRAGLVNAFYEAHSSSGAVEGLEPSLSDADPLVRAEAVQALGKLGGDQAVQDLENTLLTDVSPGVRLSAAFWLGGMKDPGAAQALGQALAREKDPNVRAQVARSLKWLGTDEAQNLLKQAVKDGDRRVRAIAAER